MPSIALNCVALDHRRPIGVERFARNVLGATDLGDGPVQCVVRSGVDRLASVLGDAFVARHSRLTRQSLPVHGTGLRILMEMFWLPFLTRRADVVLSINNFGPLWGKRGQRRLVVVHDVWFMDEGYEGGPLARRMFHWLLTLQLRRSSGVITVSGFSRREICRHFGVDESDVSVVGNCLGRRVEPVADQPGTDSPFLLLMGSARRNKNVLRALAGFQAYREKHPHSEVRLVVVGNYPADWINAAKRRFPTMSDRVEWRGFVDDDELDHLYETARGLVFVSLYEGFGIPAMEALLRGRPVLLAKGTATAEIVGELGITVDARNPAGIGDGIAKLLQSPVDTGSEAYQAFRRRYMECDHAAERLAALITNH